MCKLKRDDADPLLRAFLDTYGLHLLSNPRASIDIGQVVLRSKSGTAVVGDLDDLLDQPIGSLGVNRAEPMAAVAGQVSRAHGIETGVGVSSAFLQALGMFGVEADLRAKLEHSVDVALRFRFAEPLRDAIAPAELGGRLVQRKFDPSHPLNMPNAEYYVITAVARSRSFDILIEHQSHSGGEVRVDLADLVEIGGSVTAERLDESTWRFAGSLPIAFGIELFRAYVDEHDRMRMDLPSEPIKVRHGEATTRQPPRPIMIGGPQESAFLNLDS